MERATGHRGSKRRWPSRPLVKTFEASPERSNKFYFLKRNEWNRVIFNQLYQRLLQRQEMMANLKRKRHQPPFEAVMQLNQSIEIVWEKLEFVWSPRWKMYSKYCKYLLTCRTSVVETSRWTVVLSIFPTRWLTRMCPLFRTRKVLFKWVVDSAIAARPFETFLLMLLFPQQREMSVVPYKNSFLCGDCTSARRSSPGFKMFQVLQPAPGWTALLKKLLISNKLFCVWRLNSCEKGLHTIVIYTVCLLGIEFLAEKLTIVRRSIGTQYSI